MTRTRVHVTLLLSFPTQIHLTIAHRRWALLRPRHLIPRKNFSMEITAAMSATPQLTQKQTDLAGLDSDTLYGWFVGISLLGVLCLIGAWLGGHIEVSTSGIELRGRYGERRWLGHVLREVVWGRRDLDGRESAHAVGLDTRK
jgi:hypothetical protein